MNICIEAQSQPRIPPPTHLPFLSVTIYPDEKFESSGNTWQWWRLWAKAFFIEPPQVKKQTNKKTSVFLNTHCHPALSSVPVKTQIAHKNKQRVRWWGQGYFSSSLCNHSEALSHSENLSEYSASQQASQKQQGLKLPSSLLALHLSSLSRTTKPSWGISVQRAQTHSVSDASWPIRKISCSIAARSLHSQQGQHHSCRVTGSSTVIPKI